MYSTLLFLHSILRWLLVTGLLFSIIRSLMALPRKGPFNAADNFSRSFTSGIAHLQLIVGFILYFSSPATAYFRSNPKQAMQYKEFAFFGLFHITAMLTAVVLITIGAAKAKRASEALQKHRQVLLWFALAALLIFIAIPWPFHPFVRRPYLRSF